MRSSTLVFSGTLFFLAACAASETGDTSAAGPGTQGGAAADAGPEVEVPKPHPLCAGSEPTKTFPSDVGKDCSMGSNLALCASATSRSCSTSLCLWDDTSGGSFGDAYCTMECTPGDATSCPSGFTCKAQGCSSAPKNVCAKDGTTEPPTSTCESLSDALPGRSMTISSMAVGVDGRLYALVWASGSTYDDRWAILSRAKSGSSWSKIFESLGSASGSNASPARPLSRTKKIVFATSATTLAIVDGTNVEVATLPACTGDPNKCAREISEFVPTSTGEVRAYARNLYGDYWLLPDIRPGELVLGKKLTDRVTNIVPFASGGFVASCTPSTSSSAQPCTSKDGETFAALTLPPKETFATVVAAGESPDDFFFVGGSGKVYHHVDTEWLEEGIKGAPAVSGRFSNTSLARAADGTVFARLDLPPGDSTVRAITYALTGGCWEALPTGSSFGATGGLPVEGTTFVAPSADSVCSYQWTSKGTASSR